MYRELFRYSGTLSFLIASLNHQATCHGNLGARLWCEHRILNAIMEQCKLSVLFRILQRLAIDAEPCLKPADCKTIGLALPQQIS